MRRLWSDESARFVEDAFTLPILILVAVGMLNVLLYGVADAVAYNAAEYAARQASVAQANAAGVAVAAANQRLQALPFSAAQFRVSAYVHNRRGGLDAVTVSFSVPNYFRGLAALFGVNMPPRLSGKAVSYFRHEGW